MVRCHATRTIVKETTHPRLKYRACGCLVSSMGPLIVPIASNPLCCFVPCSICSGDADPTSEFCLRTLSIGRPTTIVGPILDTVAVSHAIVAGTMCEETGGV
jgi:hypothetical protein